MVPVALAAFAVAALACFATLPPRRAVLVSTLGGWLFLPHFDLRFSILVIHTKPVYVPAVVLAASLLFDAPRWRALRLRRIDLPILAMCAVPAATALANGLGAWEAAAASFEAAMAWGGPYLLGRAYLGSPRGVRAFAIAVVGAALVYVPFCLWEVRMSPQLHFQLYGFRPWGFSDSYRFGGFRPSVFMQHGLAVGMFMALGTLTAFWLWRSRAAERVASVPLGWATALLAATTLLAKSTGAILLLAVGIAVLEGTRRLRTSALVVALALVPPAYATARIAGWSGEGALALGRRVLAAERVGSVEFRMYNEDLLIRKAMLRPWLGWGRFGRSFVYDEEGNSIGAITDGMWIIVLGVSGLVGLAALGAVLAFPPLALLRAFPARRWAHPELAAPAALAVVVLLWAVDDLLNSMISPIYPAIAGALGTFVLLARTPRPGPKRRAG